MEVLELTKKSQDFLESPRINKINPRISLEVCIHYILALLSWWQVKQFGRQLEMIIYLPDIYGELNSMFSSLFGI